MRRAEGAVHVTCQQGGTLRRAKQAYWRTYADDTWWYYMWQQFANNSMQNIITAFQSHGCTFYQNGQMGRRCQLGWSHLMWNQTLALQIHTPPCRSGRGGENRDPDQSVLEPKLANTRIGDPTPNPPFCIQTNCYFHILCYTQQFANSMQNIITAFQSHGCTFLSKWPDGSQMSARVSTLCGTKLWHCKSTPIWVIRPDWLPTCVSAWWLWSSWVARTAGLVDSSETLGALLGIFQVW